MTDDPSRLSAIRARLSIALVAVLVAACHQAKQAKCESCLDLVPDACVYEPIPPAAWQSAAHQLGIHVGNLAEGVYGMHRVGSCSFEDYKMAAPLTSLEIIAHGHLEAITLDDGRPGIEIRNLGSKPVHIGDIPAGASRTIVMGSPVK